MHRKCENRKPGSHFNSESPVSRDNLKEFFIIEITLSIYSFLWWRTFREEGGGDKLSSVSLKQRAWGL